jgi:hypothetical protein
MMPDMKGKDQPVSNESQDLRAIETRLQRSLRPVSPRPAFIKDLRKQLVSQLQVLPTISHFGRSSVLWLGLLFMLLVFSLLLLSLRAAVVLFGLLSMFQHYQQQNGLGHDQRL